MTITRPAIRFKHLSVPPTVEVRIGRVLDRMDLARMEEDRRVYDMEGYSAEANADEFDDSTGDPIDHSSLVTFPSDTELCDTCESPDGVLYTRDGSRFCAAHRPVTRGELKCA